MKGIKDRKQEQKNNQSSPSALPASPPLTWTVPDSCTDPTLLSLSFLPELPIPRISFPRLKDNKTSFELTDQRDAF